MRYPWGDIIWFWRLCAMSDVQCLRPVRPIRVPSRDLSVVLEGLMGAPFEPLESAPDRILTLKVTLLLALTLLKRVGDLQALSISEVCMDFAPGVATVTLRPRPGYVPKVLSTSFRSQVVTLHSFHPPPFASGEDERLYMSFEDLCGPLKSLETIHPVAGMFWCWQPLVFYRISHWVKDAISLAYEMRGLSSPLSVQAHSTRSVASSPHTFIRFYNLDLDTTPGSRVEPAVFPVWFVGVFLP